MRRVWQVTFVCEASEGAEVIHHFYKSDTVCAGAVERAVREYVHDEGFMVEPGTGRPEGTYGSLTVRVPPEPTCRWEDWSPDAEVARATVRWLACPADEVLEAIAVAMRGGS